MGGGSCQTHPRACLAAQVEGLVWSPAPSSSAFPSHRAEVTLPAGHQETSLEPIATHLRIPLGWTSGLRFAAGRPAGGRMRSQCLPGKRMWFWPQRAVVVHCSTDRSAFSPAGALGCWFSGPVLSSDSPHCPALLSRHPSDPPEEAPTTPHTVTF